MRTMLALMALLALASPLAVAQDANDTKTDEDPQRPPDGSADPSSPSQAAGDDAAWVDDCPPDMMCAYQGEERPQQFGPEGCIECSGLPPEDQGSTCMDGEQENETCRDDVQYLDGGGEPTRGPVDGSCENCRGEDLGAESAETNKVPFPQLLVVVAALAGAVLLVRRG